MLTFDPEQYLSSKPKNWTPELRADLIKEIKTRPDEDRGDIYLEIAEKHGLRKAKEGKYARLAADRIIQTIANNRKQYEDLLKFRGIEWVKTA